MTTTEVKLERRLSRLERARRRLALIAGAQLVMLAALLMTGVRARPDTITATAFQLVDDSGHVRAELAVRDGAPGVFLMDEDGRTRLSLVQDSAATALFIHDSAGDTRVGVAQFAHGGGGFALHGPKMKGAAVLYLAGTGSLTFYGPEGDVLHRVPAAER